MKFGISSQTVFIDIENAEDGVVHALGAIFGAHPPLAARNAFEVKSVMPLLRAWVRSAHYVCGHNILAHDLPKLQPLKGPADCEHKVIDTLYLSPIAYPTRPYHHLTKENKLVRECRNNPVHDSYNCQQLLIDCCQRFSELETIDCQLYACAFRLAEMPGMAALFESLLPASNSIAHLQIDDTRQLLLELFKQSHQDRCCLHSLEVIEGGNGPLVLAYIHAWLKSAVGTSCIPYWVSYQIPQIRPYLRKLRTEPCADPACRYCRSTHDASAALQHFFGFASFRPTPEVRGQPGQSLQQALVAAALRDESVLGILPTGGGKSLCFQIPALHRYEATGALSIVISPLQSLMRDQVENLKNRSGIQHTAALYGMLTPVERKYCLRDIRLGHVGLLYVSPEQLRSTAFKKAIQCREIGYWIFDEAHCLSKWGHDFRVDYLYASKFIKRLAEQQNSSPPPLICVTATAKMDVKQELVEHFRKVLGHELQLFDGGTERSNLSYRVESIKDAAKTERVKQILADFYGALPEDADPRIHQRFTEICVDRGALVIFCATRHRVNELYADLAKEGWPVLPFHGGMENEKALGQTGQEFEHTKKDVLQRFLSERSVPIIVATNAFGMGVDKADIRKVIHVDATGSLENYLQEAGRAGRDGAAAECILLYESQDLETQFSMNHFSQLELRDLQKIWNAVYAATPDRTGTITVSTDEIRERIGSGFGLLTDDPDLNDTQIKTAINILEDQTFLERAENQSRVLQVRLIVNSVEQAREKIKHLRVPIDVQKLWLAVVRLFLDQRIDEKIQVRDLAALDEMFRMYERMHALGERVRNLTTFVFRTLNSMAKAEVGLLKKDLIYSALLSPRTVLRTIDALAQHEDAILQEVEESFPDMEGILRISIKRQNEILLRHDIASSLSQVERVFHFLERDGDWLGNQRAKVSCKKFNGFLHVRFEKDFASIKCQSQLRLALARDIIEHIIAAPPASADSTESLYEFTEEDLVKVLKSSVLLTASQVDVEEAIQYILVWLHENEVISLQQGRALLTSAMSITLIDAGKRNGRKRRFNKEHFEAQRQYYQDRQLQVHIVGEYANQAIRRSDESHVKFVRDYFQMERTEFVKKYFTSKEQRTVLQLATGIDSYNRIVESLDKNQIQKEIVMSDGPCNDMVLAGPGSGKTMVIAHRCAWLLRVRRVRRSAIVVLCFNRHAALELRRRIWKLVGTDAAGVIIQTFHGLALRLLGRTMAQIHVGDDSKGLHFEEIIPAAIRLLEGKQSSDSIDADVWRQRLLGNLSHILVDEYQDIDANAYRFVSLLAGKSETESENRLKILAVGDDDQSIYRFAGANVEYIRRFKQDYADLKSAGFPKPVTLHYMVENYRSSKHIIAAANAIISNNNDRMKTAHPIQIDALRSHDLHGGIMADIDPVTQGKVQFLEVASTLEQAYACVDEVRRYLALSTQHQAEQCCIVARTNAELIAVRIAFEKAAIPCSVVGAESIPSLTRIKEIYAWLRLLTKHKGKRWNGEATFSRLRRELGQTFLATPAGQIMQQIGAEFYGESGKTEVECEAILDYFYDALFESKRRGYAGPGVILSTAHKVKGLEFDNVILMDGPWTANLKSLEDLEEARRLYYVAATRARKSLTLLQLHASPTRFSGEIPAANVHRRRVTPATPDPALLDYRYGIIQLDAVYLNYAARYKRRHPVAKALKHLQMNDSVQLKSAASRDGLPALVLVDASGNELIRLSKAGTHKWLPRVGQIERAWVKCMHVRHRDDGTANDPQANETWLIPIVEVLWRNSKRV